jgi:hypothetical protein
MRLGSFGACVWIKGTMAELGHVYGFADQHCAKTAHSRDHHGHSGRLASKLKGTRTEVAKMTSECIITAGGSVYRRYPGEWPSGKATDFECVALPDDSLEPVMNVIPPQRFVNGVTWAFAPDWLTIEEACFLSGYNRGIMLQVIEVDGVDLDNAGRIEKRSLWEWLEVSVEYAHWDD